MQQSLWKFYTDLLRKKRNIWHKNCGCTCNFCFECDHGSNPIDGNCHEGSCKRCENVECSVEWNNEIIGKFFCSFIFFH